MGPYGTFLADLPIDRYSSVFHCQYITDNFLIFTRKSEIFLMIARKKVSRGVLNPQSLVPTKELTHRTGALAITTRLWGH
jgi:hypothetical protein